MKRAYQTPLPIPISLTAKRRRTEAAMIVRVKSRAVDNVTFDEVTDG